MELLFYMRVFMRNITCFALAFLFLPGCNSTVYTENSALLQHVIKYSNKGTRSEARQGYLETISGVRIPECFSYVSDNKQGYTYLERKNPWGDSGYFPVTEYKAVTVSGKSIPPEDLQRGWYKSSVKYSGTPGTWLYGESESGSYFFDAGHVNDLIVNEKLKCGEKSLFLKIKVVE